MVRMDCVGKRENSAQIRGVRVNSRHYGSSLQKQTMTYPAGGCDVQSTSHAIFKFSAVVSTPPLPFAFAFASAATNAATATATATTAAAAAAAALTASITTATRPAALACLHAGFFTLGTFTAFATFTGAVASAGTDIVALSGAFSFASVFARTSLS